jgi:hypothetical protein
MNTLTDAQLVVSTDASLLLGGCAAGGDRSAYDDEQKAVGLLAEQDSWCRRETERRALEDFFTTVRNDTRS